MNAISTISQKLLVLIPRLGTNHDGEIVATVRAIETQLRKINADWHDLAQVLTNGSESKQASDGGGRRPRQGQRNTSEQMSGEDRVRWLFDRDHSLRSRERQFIHDLFDKAETYTTLLLTEKQEAWLNAIFQRVWRQYE